MGLAGIWAWEPGEPFNPEDDAYVQSAREVVLEFFRTHERHVFYEQQIAVLLESQFFHWITKRALEIVVKQGRLRTDKLSLMPRQESEAAEGGTDIRFYWNPELRSWRRKANRIRNLVREISHGKFGHALGRHAETQFDHALAGEGFVWRARDVGEWNGVIWRSGRNLDRIYLRDGVEYGAEMKNTIGYAPKDEFEEKLRMSAAFKVRPLWIVRSFPRHYIRQVAEAGGYVLIFGQQLYPYGSERLAARVTNELGFPTATEPAQRHIRKFSEWHASSIR